MPDWIFRPRLRHCKLCTRTAKVCEAWQRKALLLGTRAGLESAEESLQKKVAAAAFLEMFRRIPPCL